MQGPQHISSLPPTSLSEEAKEIPKVLLQPEHIPMIPQVLEQMCGVPHAVSVNMLGLDTSAIMKTAWKFRKMVKNNTVAINTSVTSITIHIRSRARRCVEEMIRVSSCLLYTSPSPRDS